MSEHLLIELGCEELPAGVGSKALSAFSEKIQALLKSARIKAGSLQQYRTPRRLAILLDEVAALGEAVTEEIIGPPVSIAFKDDTPTKAAVGFAKKNGIDVNELSRVQTDKGEKLLAKIERPAVALAELLSDQLPGIVTSLPMPKSMRWNETGFRFSRPVRWLVVMHGTKVISVEIAGLKSGNESQGLRHYPDGKPGTNPVIITSADKYEEILESAHVIVDPAVRKQLISEQAKELAAPHLDAANPELLDELVDLVEAPVPFKQEFDEKYLQTPRPVLQIAMKKHQRYIPVLQRDQNDQPTDKLANCFIGVANGRTDKLDIAMIKEGNLRVLRARFDDAVFFFENDTKQPLAEYVPRLDDIMYEKRLGSIGDKVRRIIKLTEFLSGLEKIEQPVKTDALVIARLCKADLATEMVFEFPELQGVIGTEYARREGLSCSVADGIEEHYKPTPGMPLTGAAPAAHLVSLADKIDTVAGAFATGKEPTGSADPYALRRQVLGIIKIMAFYRWRIGLRQVVNQAVDLVEEKTGCDVPAVSKKIMQFIGARLEVWLRDEQGFAHDEIEAVLTNPWHDIDEVLRKIDAVKALKRDAHYRDIVVALKRTINITRGADDIPDRPDPEKFQEESEKRLFVEVERVASSTEKLIAERNYRVALEDLSGLRETIDKFFDDVMVMCEDGDLRRNRLALVSLVGQKFLAVADFSKLKETM